MPREFKTRKGIEKKVVVYNMPLNNLLIFILIVVLTLFVLMFGFSLKKIISIVLIDLFSYIILTTFSENKIIRLRKKYFGQKLVIKINSIKPFR